MVVEEITGRGLEELAREIIFDPLGMTRTSYVWKEEFEKNYAWPHDEFERPWMKDRRSGAEAAGSMQTTAAEAGIGVVLLSNCDNFESVAREIVAAVIGPDESPFDWLGYPRFDPTAKKVPPPGPKAVEVEAKILADYVGDYLING
ncbi:MAG: serine hydrolase domain-containing protein [Candidatus Aminicenantales bacterium]